MKLLLTSQGLQSAIVPTFMSLLTKPAQDVKVAFITTGAYGQDDDTSWLETYRIQLRNCGITQIFDMDIKYKTFIQLQEILLDKDIIFVNGGNTFYLLKYLKLSGFDKLFKDF